MTCGFGRCGTVTECMDCGRAPGKAPSPQPAMPTEPPDYVELACPHCETLLCVDLDELRASLATQGLHIVGPAERAVLDAIKAVPDGTLKVLVDPVGVAFNSTLMGVFRAELALRAAKDPNV
jgi:hypothetical protein